VEFRDIWGIGLDWIGWVDGWKIIEMIYKYIMYIKKVYNIIIYIVK
jgi:hypothetical protein